MILEAKSKLLMIGDSITDCGRDYPVGEAPFDGLGNGYVSLVDGWLRALYPALQVRVMNLGVSGNTVTDLALRWQDDVLAMEPDYVSVMIGVNDVWRHFDQPLQVERHVDITTYYNTLDALVRQTRPRVKAMFLLSPFYLEPNRSDLMRQMVDAYGAQMKRVADLHEGVYYVDVQAAFDEVMADVYTAMLARDRVHPNVTGHLVIARAFLQAVEISWPRA